jgi:DegV family protein with EDD domain
LTERIALITDSSCDLGAEVIAEHGIHVLPLYVIYGDRSYRDRVDITPSEVYERLEREVPTTSTPSHEDALGLFRKIREAGFTHALAVHISSGLSGTMNVVRAAAEEVTSLKTTVIDSLSLSMGLGQVVEEAAQWLKQRVPLDEVVSRTREMISHSKAYFVLKTIEYLRRGGRIGAVSAALAGALDLKPIISIDEHGKYYSHSRVRGRNQSLRGILEIVREGVAAGANRVAVMHGGAEEEARSLRESILKLPGVSQVTLGQISPALVVHTGPGLVGVALGRA